MDTIAPALADVRLPRFIDKNNIINALSYAQDQLLASQEHPATGCDCEVCTLDCKVIKGVVL